MRKFFTGSLSVTVRVRFMPRLWLVAVEFIFVKYGRDIHDLNVCLEHEEPILMQ